MTRMDSGFRAAGVAESGIAQVAVIGAGAMGSGIAAQFANAGVPVILLDIPGQAGGPRNAPAATGVERQIKARGFMGASGPARVVAGNIEDDIGLLAEADWIIEAIIERIDLKRDLYKKIDAVRKPGSIVSSNTSTIPRAALVDGQSEALKRDFVITHFFNPPRVMQLVEIVAGPETLPPALAQLVRASETLLGKTPIICRDTPGFIANRIGCFWMAAAASEAIRQGITVEQADAAHGALGIPRTGVFGLFDLVGIDLVPQVWSSLMQALPDNDELHAHDIPGNAVFADLVDRGDFGRKSGAGFYRKAADGEREALDLRTGSYRSASPVDPKDLPGGGRDLVGLLDGEGPVAAYAWSVFAAVIAYAAEHGPQIASSAEDVDTAVTLGYAWRNGPFALAETYGVQKLVSRFEAEGRPVPSSLRAALAGGSVQSGFSEGGFAPMIGGALPERVTLAGLRASGRPLVANDCASLWDMGDGIACFEIHTKMNTFAPGVHDALAETLDLAGGPVRALVLGNDDPRAFSAGADLGFILEMLQSDGRGRLDRYISRGQELFLGLKYAPVPVVAAMHGFAMGGGCEFALHADAIVAHAELTAGLPETNVGLIPAWGGCTQLLIRAAARSGGPKGPVAEAVATFGVMFPARLSGSAEEARDIGILRDGDEIAMHRGLVLAGARAKAEALLAAGYSPPEKAWLKLSGASGRTGILVQPRVHADADRISAVDLRLAETLADVLSGGTEAGAGLVVDEQGMMAAEKRALLELSGSQTTIDRMEHMLSTGKPLRN